MDNKVEFKKVIKNKNLVVESTYNCINNLFSEDEKAQFFVAEINPKLWMELNYVNITN